MPTEYTPCEECFYHEHLSISHEWNQLYFQDQQKAELLAQKNLPYHQCTNIVFEANKSECKQCTSCQKKNKVTLLCKKHTERAIKNGKYYDGKGIKCDGCCWWDV